MSERVREIFAQLPSEGIAIHGTNLARAKKIQELGFVSEFKPFGRDGHYYFAVHPEDIPEHKLSGFLKAVKSTYIRYAVDYSMGKTHDPMYKLENDPQGSTVPSLVIFKPLERQPPKNMNWVRHESQDIPAENIIGIIELNSTDKKKVRSAYRKIVALLEERRIIQPPKPQSLPAE